VSIGLMGAWFCGWIRGWQDLLEKVVCFSPTVWMDQSFFRHCNSKEIISIRLKADTDTLATASLE